jgi:fructose/tagatose bisphosphate aldolase
MAFITDREWAKDEMDKLVKKGASLAIFCTGSHWNTEAILRAAQSTALKYGLKRIPVSVAMTSNYVYMQQTKRVTRSGEAKIGLKAVMDYCKLLCDASDSPYGNVDVLPHLDHADPEKDKWELTEGLKYFSSVMFDAQKYSYMENVRMTKEYVQEYGNKVLVEGAVESLGVSGMLKAQKKENYIDKAMSYVKTTGVDYLVADLGTEQQSEVMETQYQKKRARELTKGLGKSMLVLHGTSSLRDEDIKGFSKDGVVRVNMWTRIVRQAGQYAAKRLLERYPLVEKNNFNACEAKQYIDDNIDCASDIMSQVLESLGYNKL